MFRAISRWFKAVGYLLTGQIDSARRELDTNPGVMGAKYDEIVREKTSRIQEYKKAVGGLIAQQETKLEKVKELTDEVNRLENLKAGALAKAKKRVEELQGQGASKETIHADEDYLRCQSAFRDFSSTLTEKQARIDELEGDVDDYAGRIAEHKVQLQSLLREVEKIRSEKSDAIADMISAREEKEIADTLAGIAEDGTAEELQRMRQLRQEVKAESKISRELAGTDTHAQEAEFLEFAQASQAADEFDALIGLAEKVEDTGAAPQPDEASRDPLPE